MFDKKLIDKLALLYIKDRKVLFVRSISKKIFYTVGGKREIGETDTEALTRECKEELGVCLIPETIKFLNIFNDIADNNENISIKITCYEANFLETPKPSSEIEEMAWFTSKDIERTTSTGKQILLWLNEKNLID
ncbi:MAG: NUDIX domain-containing protein [bacterium]